MLARLRLLWQGHCIIRTNYSMWRPWSRIICDNWWKTHLLTIYYYYFNITSNPNSSRIFCNDNYLKILDIIIVLNSHCKIDVVTLNRIIKWINRDVNTFRIAYFSNIIKSWSRHSAILSSRISMAGLHSMWLTTGTDLHNQIWNIFILQLHRISFP